MDQSNTTTKRYAAPHGFSLIEITLVLLIMGMLAGVAAVSMSGQMKKARRRTTWTDMSLFKTSLKTYMADHQDALPDSLVMLITQEYIESHDLEDQWGTPFYYAIRPGDFARRFDLISAGPDKEFGTQDDMDIWTFDLDA